MVALLSFEGVKFCGLGGAVSKSQGRNRISRSPPVERRTLGRTEIRPDAVFEFRKKTKPKWLACLQKG